MISCVCKNMTSKCHIQLPNFENVAWVYYLTRFWFISSFFFFDPTAPFSSIYVLNILSSYSCILLSIQSSPSFSLFLCVSSVCCGQMDAHLHSSLSWPGNECFCLAPVSVHLYGFSLSDNKELRQQKHSERHIIVITKRGCKGKKKGK